MSSETMPEWAEKVAQDFHDKWDTGMSGAAFRDLVRALLAAEQRGRKAGLEEAATVAEGYDGDGLIGSYDCHLGDARLTVREIAAAIRSLGEKI